MNENHKPALVVTGANGLLGRHLVSKLRADYRVNAIVHTPPAEPVDAVEYHVADLESDWSTVDWPDDVHGIIHLAQSAHFREFPEQALRVFRVNIESTARLLDYGQRQGVKKFVYASSGGIYGSGKAAFDEEAPIVPPGKLGHYLGSKLCSEILAQSYARHMTVVVLRLFFMYGPGQKRSMLIPRLVDSIAAGRPVSLHGTEGIRINPIHVTDAANALIDALALSEGGTFNVGGPEVLSLCRIAEIIGTKVGVAPVFETQAGEAADLIGNIEAMKAQLRAPTIRFADGVKDVLPTRQ